MRAARVKSCSDLFPTSSACNFVVLTTNSNWMTIHTSKKQCILGLKPYTTEQNKRQLKNCIIRFCLVFTNAQLFQVSEVVLPMVERLVYALFFCPPICFRLAPICPALIHINIIFLNSIYSRSLIRFAHPANKPSTCLRMRGNSRAGKNPGVHSI